MPSFHFASRNNSLSFQLGLFIHSQRLSIICKRPLAYFLPFCSPFPNCLSSPFFSFITVFTSRQNHGVFFSLGVHRKFNQSLLTVFQELLYSRKSDKKFRISKISNREFLRPAVEGDTASSQRVTDVPRTKMDSTEADTFASIFAAKDPFLLPNTKRNGSERF